MVLCMPSESVLTFGSIKLKFKEYKATYIYSSNRHQHKFNSKISYIYVREKYKENIKYCCWKVKTSDVRIK